MGWAFARFRDETRRRIARFAQARGGAAAVEFALISVPFFLLLFGIIELAALFLLSTTLDNATNDAARRIRTGELQTQGGASAATFKATVCSNLGWLNADCTKNLYIDVQTFGGFSAAASALNDSTKSPIKAGKFTPPTSFSLGGPSSVVVVRAYYKWPFFTPMVSKAMSQLGDGSSILTATATFRNEPYGS